MGDIMSLKMNINRLFNIVPKTCLLIGIRLLIFHLLILQCSMPVLAKESSTPDTEDLFDMSIEELMDMEIVSASKKVETVRETPSNITIVTEQQIKEWGARHLQDVLKRVAGYYMVRDRDEWVWATRGTVSDNNQEFLVLIDGHRMSSIDNFGPGQIIELPNDLSNVKRIEIIKGPGSAVWGSGALSGVVNIITKDAADLGELKQHSSVTMGEDDTYKANFQMGRVYENADWILHGSYITANGKAVRQSSATSDFPIFDTATGFSSHPYGTYTTDLDRYDDSYMVYFKGNSGKFSLNGMAFTTSQYNRHYETGKGRENFLSTEKYFLESAYRDNLGDWDFTWKGFLHYNKAEYENKKDHNGARPTRLEKVWKDKSIGTSMNLTRQFTDNIFFNSGIEYTYTRTGPDDSTSIAQTAPFTVTKSTAHFEDQDITGYALLDYYLTEDLKLTGGTGVSYNDDRGEDAWVSSPRGGIIWNASENTTHKLLYNSAYFRPATFQATNNPNMDSEEMTQFEYILMKKIGRANVTTTLYWQELEGYINILSLGGGSTQFNNSGDYKSRGIEVEFTTPLWEDHILWANAAYCDAEAGGFTSTLPFNSRRVNPSGEVLSYPEVTFNIGGTFHSLDKKTFISPAMRYVGEVEYRATPATTASLTDAMYRHVGPFAYLDLNIGYEPNKNLGFYVNFINLTNIDSRNHLSIWNGTIDQPGRYIEFKILYKF